MSDFFEEHIKLIPETEVEKFCYIMYHYINEHRDVLGYPRNHFTQIPMLYITNDLVQKFENFMEICSNKPDLILSLDVVHELLYLLLETYENADNRYWHSKPKKYVEDLLDLFLVA